MILLSTTSDAWIAVWAGRFDFQPDSWDRCSVSHHELDLLAVGLLYTAESLLAGEPVTQVFHQRAPVLIPLPKGVSDA